METYHVYQFYDANGNIIYVGKTKNAVRDRMKQHFGPNGHLSQDILQQVKCIKYYEFLTERDMDLTEAYLIRKYKGLYNTKREHISKEDIKYIEDKMSKQKIKHYWGQIYGNNVQRIN